MDLNGSLRQKWANDTFCLENCLHHISVKLRPTTKATFRATAFSLNKPQIFVFDFQNPEKFRFRLITIFSWELRIWWTGNVYVLKKLQCYYTSMHHSYWRVLVWGENEKVIEIQPMHQTGKRAYCKSKGRDTSGFIGLSRVLIVPPFLDCNKCNTLEVQNTSSVMFILFWCTCAENKDKLVFLRFSKAAKFHTNDPILPDSSTG